MLPDLNINNIVWKAEYNIGDLKIDKEHQTLFLLARKVLAMGNLHDDEKEKHALKTLIKELFEYVGTHFSNEQHYMAETKYPELEYHKKLHHIILTMLTDLMKEINILKIEEIEIRLYKFIYEYFVKHIIMEDKKIQLWNISLEDLRKSFGWKDIYSIGNEVIDEEHKKLFDIAKQAFRIVDDEHRNEKIKIILIALYDYMKTHFSHEEEYMTSIHYPKLEEHKVLHKEIIENMNVFVKQFPSLNIELFEKELARLIDISLVQHIIQEDKKILAWYNQGENTLNQK